MKFLLRMSVLLLSCVSAFAQFTPTLTSLGPQTGTQGATVAVTLTGTNFVTNATTLNVDNGNILPLSVRVDSTGSAVATVVLVGAGVSNISVVTPNGASAPAPFTVSSGLFSRATQYDLANFAGTAGGAGAADGDTVSARFFTPAGIWTDGTNAYIADLTNSTIRRMDLNSGQVSTIAGFAGRRDTTDGIGSAATFISPWGIWGDGSNLYITDASAFTVRKLKLSTGEVTTIAGSPRVAGTADGVGAAAQFAGPSGIWGDGTNLYVADTFSTAGRSIRRIDMASGTVATVSDLGTSATASSYGVGLWGDGTALWIADSGRQTIRRMTLPGGTAGIFAGFDNLAGLGSTTTPAFRNPSAVWGSGTDLFIADTDNGIIRKMSLDTKQNSVVTGIPLTRGWVDGPLGSAAIGAVSGLWGAGSTLYFTETSNNTLRQVDIATGNTATIGGRPAIGGSADGVGSAALFNFPTEITGDSNNLYLGDYNGSTLRKVDTATGTVSTLAGTPRVGNSASSIDGTGSAARFGQPAGVWANGINLYVTDDAFDTVRKAVIGSAAVTTIAGSATADSGSVDGLGAAARFRAPFGIWGDGQNLYIADRGNFTIRKMNLASGSVTTFAGSAGIPGTIDGFGTSARFANPFDLWGDGTNLYLLDANDIRKIVIATGEVTTFAGSSVVAGYADGQLQDARFSAPLGLWGDGSNLFIADSGNHVVRKIDLAAGQVSTILRRTQSGINGALTFDRPIGIWGDGNFLYVVDANSNAIRVMSPIAPVAPVNPSILTFTIPDRAGVSRITSGAAPDIRTGYAMIEPSSGNTTPAGLAIFGFSQNGVLVSEAAVPAAPPIRSGRIYAEISGSVDTGLAIANPNDQDAAITFYYTDANGTTLLFGNATIAAKSQKAAFLDQAPFVPAGPGLPNLASARTFTFSSTQPVGVVAIRGNTNERGEFLITTLPVTSIDSSSNTAIAFPHYADGGGWTTQVILVNPTDSTITGTAQFYSQGTVTPATAGVPVTLTVNGVSGSSFSYTIPARSAFKLQTANTATLTRSGSVRVTPSSGSTAPSGLVVFGYRPAGVTVAEAGVPALPSASAFRIYVEASGDFSGGAAGSIQTGLAISNPSASNAVVTFELTTLDGTSTGLTANTTVPANGQTAMFLNQISGFATLPTPFQGVLRVSAATPVSLTGLRGRYNERRDFLITTTAPVDESRIPSTTPSVFPHLADGGGYTTQFILFSGDPGQSSNGTLRFFTASGAALNLTLR